MEPTPGAGPCIGDELDVDETEFNLLYGLLESTEYNWVDVLIYRSDGVEAFLECFIGVDCLRIIDLRIRVCGSSAIKGLKHAGDWPEVSRLVFEGDCIEMVVPSTPPGRVRSALGKLGVGIPLAPVAFRVRG